MNIVIIEDEVLAANKLEEFILKYNSNFKILAKIRSVKTAIKWFEANGLPELLFLDIHLLDGNSFEILKEVEITCPVIFTTAYDSYALEAFKVNSIDYLLKPISFSKLKGAFQKLETLKGNIDVQQSKLLNDLLETVEKQGAGYKTRFLVKSGSKMFSLPVNQINHFYSEDRITFLLSNEGKRFMINQTLEELESLLDPAHFFRINRQMIVHIDSIKVTHKHFKGRFKIELNIKSPIEEIMVSSRRVSDFQFWLDR